MKNSDILKLNMQFFAEGDPVDDPATDPVDDPATDPATDPSDDPVDDPTENLVEEMKKLKEALAKEEARRKKAEGIIQKKTAEEKLKKKENMTEAERLQAEREELQEKISQYEIGNNKLAVQEIFVTNGIQKESYDDLMNFIVTEDADRSVAAANEIMALISAVTENKLKEAEKIWMKSTPKPPSGDKTDEDEWISEFRKEAMKY